MKFILMLFLLGQPGPQSEMAPFQTLEECEAEKTRVVQVIAEHNEKEAVKIFFYAAACLPVQKAPQGKDV